MAKIRNINIVEDIVKEYSTEEIIAFLAKELSAICRRNDERLRDDSPQLLYLDLPNVLKASMILNELDKKLNGQSGPKML